MKRRIRALPWRLVVLATLFTPLAARPAGHAHEHGVARLDVAVEGTKIMLMLDTPLDTLVGFEHEPRNDAEHQKADAAVSRLKAADDLLVIDGAAQCKLTRLDLVSAALKLGVQAEPDPDGHAEIEASYEFTCRNAGRAGFVDVGLFEAFPRMARVDVQAITPKGQLKVTLKRPARRIALVR